jgi:hypothetical protein
MKWADIFGFEKDPRSYGKYVRKPSPDKEHALVFEPGMEVSMMRYVHECRLIDRDKKVAQDFKGLTCPVQFAWWSPDSKIVAFPTNEGAGLVLYKVRSRKFSLLFFNPFQQDLKLTGARVVASVNKKEFEATFGDGFDRPNDNIFKFAELSWFDAPAGGKWKLGPAVKSAPKMKWEPPPSKEFRAYARKIGITLPK